MPKLREAVLDDINNIIALMHRNNVRLANNDSEEWLHLWKNNPALKSYGRKWPIGWVLEGDDRQIVGFFGNIPQYYELQGKRFTAAVASSWVVDKKYRNHSISLINSYFSQQTVDIFIDTTANKIAGKVFSGLFKAKKMPALGFDNILFWIINYRGFLKSLFAKKGVPYLGPAAAMVAVPAKCYDAIRLKKPFVKNSADKIRILQTFDARFDTLWHNITKNNYKFMRTRTSEWLNWQFKYAIIKKNVWIAAIEEKDEIKSYAIFLRQDNLRIGLKRMRLIDFQAIDNNKSALVKMVSYAAQLCAYKKIDVLEAGGLDAEKINILEILHPYKRKLACWPFFYKAKDPLLLEKLKSADLWAPSFLDGDAAL